MITGEEMLEELIKIEPSRLDENTQKLFYTIMKVIDERDELQERLERIENYLDKNYTVENQYWFDHIRDIVKDR